MATMIIAMGCTRTPAPVLQEYTDQPAGFTVRYPTGWTAVPDADGSGVRLVPPTFAQKPAAAPEFIFVLTKPSEARLDEGGRRRVVFTQLSVHGVSEFQRDARTTAAALWERFEVTGANDDVEWASFGLVIAGDARYYLVVCAKPLTQWKSGQHECEQVIGTFRPGAFTP